MRKNVLILGCILVMASCSDEITPIEPVSEIVQETELPTVSSEGYLSFPSSKSLESFFEQIQNGNEPPLSVATRGGGHFESIAKLDERIASTNQTRAILQKQIEDSDELEELEEMSKDEYNLMKAENLLFDNLMTHAMDTTLRICVDGILYKITNNGTFSVKQENADKLEPAIKNFSSSVKERTGAGETVLLDSDVRYTNTFKKVRIEECDLQESDLEYVPEIPKTRAASNSSKNEFHSSYNVDSYRWKNNGVFLKFLDRIRGKDVSKEKKFDKKHRVQVNVFDVNYAFYKSAGIKVQMQKRKKFLFVPYWVNTEADKLAIGFNEMDGVLSYKNPCSMSSINPTASAKWGKLTGPINKLYGDIIYGTYHDLKFVKDWTDYIFGWMPVLKIGNKNYTDQVINKLYNLPADKVYQVSKSLVNKKVYAPVEKYIKPTDPMLAYLIWGSSEFHFDKEHPYITGVKEYSSRKSKSVIFDRSFGATVIGVVPIPYTPSDFDINSIDAFGAAYYDRKWLGVRFYY